MLDRKKFILKTERGEMAVERGDEVLLEYTDYTGYDGATRVYTERIVRVERLRDAYLNRPDYIEIDWMHFTFNLEGFLLRDDYQIINDKTRIHPLTPEVRQKYERVHAWNVVLEMNDNDWNSLYDEDVIAITKIIEKRLGER